MNLMLWQCGFIILIMSIYDYLKPSLPRFIQPVSSTNLPSFHNLR